jgi:hypothetical protein
MANFGPSKTWTDGEVLSHTDLNAALLDIINNVTNNNINADNIDETDDYAWSGVNSFSGGHSIKVLSNAAGSIVTGTTLEWDPADGGQMTDNSSGISIDFKLPDASDNQDVFASIAAICLDDAAGSEDGELSFRVAVGGTNTEKMTLSNSALTVTPAITASGGVSGNVTSSNVSITGGSISGITDLAIADGGTGSSSASGARTNLGLAIGSDIQAYDSKLAAIAGLAVTDGNIIVGNGSTWVAESAGTARTSLGLGSIATQAADNVSISGGSLTGMTSYSGGSFSGTTGVFSGDVTVDTDTLFVDVSEDKVALGHTTPQVLLHTSAGGSNAGSVTGNTQAIFANTSAAGAVSRVCILAGTGSGYSVLDFGDTDATNSGGITYNHGADSMAIGTTDGGTDLLIDTDGRVMIGFSSSQNSAYKLQVNSQIYATSATVATSDQQYKQNVQSLTGATALVSALNPVQFDWKKHSLFNFDTENTQLGFVAQEVQTALSGTDYVSSIVKSNTVAQEESTDVNGNVIPAINEQYLGIAEGNMIALLTAALKETIARVDALES